MLESTEVRCPYCGALLRLLVDPSGGTSDYIEDCQVCCRPIQCRLLVDNPGEEGAWSLQLRRDDE